MPTQQQRKRIYGEPQYDVQPNVIVGDNDAFAFVTAEGGSTSSMFYRSQDGYDWETTPIYYYADPYVDYPNFFVSALIFGNGYYVAFAYNSSRDVFRSSDNGASWLRLPNAFPVGDRYISASAFGNGVFVCVDFSTGLALRSADNGVTWTSHSVGVSGAYPNALKFGNGQFTLLAGTSTRYSTDGITWSAGGANGGCTLLTVFSGLFYAMNPNNGNIRSSSNGVTWSAVLAPALPGSASYMALMVFNGKLTARLYVSGQVRIYVLDGGVWTYYAIPGGYLSPNGFAANAANIVSFTQYNENVEVIDTAYRVHNAAVPWTYFFNGHSASSELGTFMVLGNAGADVWVYNPAGYTGYFGVAQPTIGYQCRGITATDDFIVSIREDRTVYVSFGGLTLSHTVVPGIIGASATTSHNGVAYVLCPSDSKLWSTSDGTNWTYVVCELYDAFTLSTHKLFAFDDALLFFAGLITLIINFDGSVVNDTMVRTIGTELNSNDGRSMYAMYTGNTLTEYSKLAGFTVHTLPRFGKWFDTYLISGTYIVLGDDSTALVSEDLDVWTEISIPDLSNYSFIVASLDTLVVAEYNGDVRVTTDGVTWTLHAGAINTALLTDGYYNAVWTGSYFLAAAYGDPIAIKSYDGIAWTEFAIGAVAHDWWAHIYGNGKHVLVSDDGFSAVSVDGETWIVSEALTDVPTDVSSFNGELYITGDRFNSAFSNDGLVWRVEPCINEARQYLEYGNGQYYASFQSWQAVISDDINFATYTPLEINVGSYFATKFKNSVVMFSPFLQAVSDPSGHTGKTRLATRTTAIGSYTQVDSISVQVQAVAGNNLALMIKPQNLREFRISTDLRTWETTLLDPATAHSPYQYMNTIGRGDMFYVGIAGDTSVVELNVDSVFWTDFINCEDV